MSATVTLKVNTAKLQKRFPPPDDQRVRKAFEEIVSKIDIELGTEVTATMVPSGDVQDQRLEAIAFFRRNGITHPITEKNKTPNLRIITGKLSRSYTQKDDPAHISKLEMNGWQGKLTFGSSQKSKNDFPYAASNEKTRPHLKRAAAKFKESAAKYATELKQILIKIIRDT